MSANVLLAFVRRDVAMPADVKAVTVSMARTSTKPAASPTAHLSPRAFAFAAAASIGALLVGRAFVACTPEPDEPSAAKPAASTNAARKTAQVPACDSKTDPLLTAEYSDDFDRADLGADWRVTSFGAYVIRSKQLCTAKPKNHPLWLKRKLPTNVRVEFDAKPLNVDGDVKAEIFGDGCSFDPNGGDYTSTGYVGVLGAHKNTENWLVRLFEHGTDAKKTVTIEGGTSIADSKLEVSKSYHVELSRTDGHELRFVVDGTLVHAFVDPKPLMGEGHDHFAFDGWEAGVCFDKLKITPLP